MAYRFKARRPVASELRRIVHKQLALAIEELHHIGNQQSDAAIHEARRHIKKARAAIRLVQPAFGGSFSPVNRRLRTAARLLAPVADGEAVVDTLSHLNTKFARQFTPATLASIRLALIERATRIDRKAELDRVLLKATRMLRAERSRVPAWQLTQRGFRAIDAGLENSFRKARRAMRRAQRRPTMETYHAWRQRVKDLWFQVRLLEARCGNRLWVDERRLETLDGCLGEHHNVALLEDVLMREALVSRSQTARCLRVLRRYQAQLRRRAGLMGTRIFREKAKHFRRRVGHLWRSARHGSSSREARVTVWRHAA